MTQSAQNEISTSQSHTSEKPQKPSEKWWVLPSKNDNIILLARQQYNLDTIATLTKTSRDYVRNVIARASKFGLIKNYVLNIEDVIENPAPANKTIKALALIAARESGLSYAEIARRFWFANAAQARNAVWRARTKMAKTANPTK